MKIYSEKYDYWKKIDYHPSIREIFPYILIKYLPPSAEILDIGCNIGDTCRFLAPYAARITGIDVNKDAISKAINLISDKDKFSIKYQKLDILKDKINKKFDAILMIRFLTCLPNYDHWKKAIDIAYSILKKDGIIYIYDFLYSKNLKSYKERYLYGEKNLSRKGNFIVNDKNNKFLFTAHHHTKEEVAYITDKFRKLYFEHFKNKSLNGNICKVFEFIGKK